MALIVVLLLVLGGVGFAVVSIKKPGEREKEKEAGKKKTAKRKRK